MKKVLASLRLWNAAELVVGRAEILLRIKDGRAGLMVKGKPRRFDRNAFQISRAGHQEPRATSIRRITAICSTRTAPFMSCYCNLKLI